MRKIGPRRYIVTWKGVEHLVYYRLAWKCRQCRAGTPSRPECNHIKAVQVVRQEFSQAGRPSRRLKKWRDRDWKAIMGARKDSFTAFWRIALRLIEPFDDDLIRSDRGRTPFDLRTLLMTALVYGRLGTSMDFACDAINGIKGIPDHIRAISRSKLADFVNDPATEAILDRVLLVSTIPIATYEDAITVDGTGLKTFRFGPYCEDRWGEDGRRVKLFLFMVPAVLYCDQMVPAVGFTVQRDENKASESAFMLPLVETVLGAFNLTEVGGDAAHTSKINMYYFLKNGIDGQVPFKLGMNPNLDKRDGVDGAYAKTAIKYAREGHHHELKLAKQQNSESFNNGFKELLGHGLRCKKPVAWRNEARLMLICWNLHRWLEVIKKRDILPDFIAAYKQASRLPGWSVADLVPIFNGPKVKEAIDSGVAMNPPGSGLRLGPDEVVKRRPLDLDLPTVSSAPGETQSTLEKVQHGDHIQSNHSNEAEKHAHLRSRVIKLAKEGMAVKDIAEAVERSPGRVSQILSEEGLPRRRKHHPPLRPEEAERMAKALGGWARIRRSKNGDAYYWAVKSVYENGKVKQISLAYLGPKLRNDHL